MKEGYVKIEDDIRVMLLQAKDHQASPATGEA